MIELRGDVFQAYDSDAICITTNGYITRKNLAVMGAGVARVAKDTWPGIDATLADYINNFGNIVNKLTKIENDRIVLPTFKGNYEVPYHILSFPVKPSNVTVKEDLSNIVTRWRYEAKKRRQLPGWMAKARVDLIRESAQRLRALTDFHKWAKISLPLPGCGNGELDYSRVRPILDKEFDDRFFIYRL